MATAIATATATFYGSMQHNNIVAVIVVETSLNSKTSLWPHFTKKKTKEKKRNNFRKLFQRVFLV